MERTEMTLMKFFFLRERKYLLAINRERFMGEPD